MASNSNQISESSAVNLETSLNLGSPKPGSDAIFLDNGVLRAEVMENDVDDQGSSSDNDFYNLSLTSSSDLILSGPFDDSKLSDSLESSPHKTDNNDALGLDLGMEYSEDILDPKKERDSSDSPDSSLEHDTKSTSSSSPEVMRSSSERRQSSAAASAVKVETAADRAWILDNIKDHEQWTRVEGLKKFYSEIPTEEELYREIFKCKQCEKFLIPTPEYSIYCTKCHLFCLNCREEGDGCGWIIPDEDMKVCGRNMDSNVKDPFALHIFKIVSFPCPNASTGCKALVSGKLLLEKTGSDEAFVCDELHGNFGV